MQNAFDYQQKAFNLCSQFTFRLAEILADVYWTHIKHTEINQVGLIYWKQCWMINLMRRNRKQNNNKAEMK